MFNPIGIAIGQVLPPMLVNANSDGSVSGMRSLMLVEAGAATVVTLLAFFFYQDKPATPPSRSLHSRHMRKQDMAELHGRHSLCWCISYMPWPLQRWSGI